MCSHDKFFSEVFLDHGSQFIEIKRALAGLFCFNDASSEMYCIVIAIESAGDFIHELDFGHYKTGAVPAIAQCDQFDIIVILCELAVFFAYRLQAFFAGDT